MPEGKHSVPDDNSFWLSLGRHLGAAVALVLVVAAAFWTVGQVRGPETDGPVVAGEPTPAATTPDADASPDPTGEPTDDPVVTPEPSGDPTGEPEPSAEPSPSPEPSPTPTPSPTPSPTPTATPTPKPSATASGSFAPGDISVQILDAVLDDGGDKAGAARDRLRGDGYRVVASNKASRVYDVTTVFYTAGNEAKARQIAKQYGFKAVEPKPDNLSDSVAVHLVVGRDYR